MRKPLRGVESHHEQKQQQLLRDTRTMGEKFKALVTSPDSAAVIMIVAAIMGFAVPAIFDIALVCGLVLFLIAFLHKATLPFRLPRRSNLQDYNDLLPGSNKPQKARGISFFGNDIKTNQELWFSNEDMRTHVLIFGSTGSGKTVALTSFAFNALIQGSGFIYVDGKGDNSLFASMFSMARSMGREDDLLLVNFMTGARDVIGAQKSRLSNTMNPFATGSSSMLAQLVISLMDASSASPDGDMWKGRAIGFIEALMRILTYMRDRGDILLDANSIRNYFLLPKLESIVIDKKFPLEDGSFVDISGIPDIVVQPLYNYVVNLPGYNEANKGKQAGEVLEQHGFITMQLTRVFTSLADTYGHIIRTNLAEVDFQDVVLNRRILVVLLPALEKSPAELGNLGKIIVASLKAMMASGLGEEVEGTYQDVIERKPTTSPTPYMCILDEYGYYAVEGFSVVPAQARSLGFSAIFAGQDLPAFQKASKEEAASIGANTNIKMCMKLEDPTETLEFFVKTAGEAYVTTTGGFQTKAGSSVISNNYLDTQGAQVEKRSRIELLDLKDQDVGEAHIFFKSQIIRARTFYANPKPVKEIRVNQFLKVDIPTDPELIALAKRIDDFKNIFDNPQMARQQPAIDPDLEFIVSKVGQAPVGSGSAAAAGMLYDFYKQQSAEELVSMEVESKPLLEGMNIFYSPTAKAETQDPLALLGMGIDTSPMLNKADAKKRLEPYGTRLW